MLKETADYISQSKDYNKALLLRSVATESYHMAVFILLYSRKAPFSHLKDRLSQVTEAMCSEASLVAA